MGDDALGAMTHKRRRELEAQAQARVGSERGDTWNSLCVRGDTVASAITDRFKVSKGCWTAWYRMGRYFGTERTIGIGHKCRSPESSPNGTLQTERTLDAAGADLGLVVGRDEPRWGVERGSSFGTRWTARQPLKVQATRSTAHPDWPWFRRRGRLW